MPAIDCVVRWRPVDLVHWVFETFGISTSHDQRTASTYIFGAVCPAASLVLPWCNTEATHLDLAETSARVAPGRHAVLVMDQAGWHVSARLTVPSNITIVSLPAKCPELNPQENAETYCGLWTQAERAQQAVFGVAERVLEPLRALGGVEEKFRVPATSSTPSTVIALIDSEAIELSLDRVCAGIGAEVLFGTMVVGAARDGDRIISATLQDDRGPREVSAPAFVDASGEGDLATFGGAFVRYGNHDFAQAGTLGVRFGGVASTADVSSGRWPQAIREAKRRGAALLDKEDGMVFRLPISGYLMCLYVDATYDALDSVSMSGAERAGREKAQACLHAIKTI